MMSSAAVPSTEELRAALLGAMQRQRRHLEECAARHELSFQAAVALLQLHRPWPGSPLGATAGEAGDEAVASHEAIDGLPMRELADRISCDPSQVTGIADRLEHLGLVERRTSDQDRRVKRLVVTDTGHAVAEQLAADLNGDAPGLRKLQDAERVQLLALLRKIGDDPT
jgi:DNA-binding MarR family transcriptional regulator